MCTPSLKKPDQVAEKLTPDFADIAKSRKAAAGSPASLLTSPSGVSLASQNYGGSALLGS